VHVVDFPTIDEDDSSLARTTIRAPCVHESNINFKRISLYRELYQMADEKGETV
jgi:hypothetical protein